MHRNLGVKFGKSLAICQIRHQSFPPPNICSIRYLVFISYVVILMYHFTPTNVHCRHIVYLHRPLSDWRAAPATGGDQYPVKSTCMPSEIIQQGVYIVHAHARTHTHTHTHTQWLVMDVSSKPINFNSFPLKPQDFTEL